MTTTSEWSGPLQQLDPEGAWLVGGAVRDQLADVESRRDDWDLAVSNGDEWSRAAAERLSAPRIRLSEQFEVWRIPLLSGGGQIDIWNLPDGDIERDLARRDFTVNALAVPLAAAQRGAYDESVVDLFEGRADIAQRRLRLVSQGAFVDDPIRMLRAVRLEAEGGWRPDAAVRASMRQHHALLHQTRPERQWMELSRVFRSDRLTWALRRLEQSSLLDEILPELTRCRGVEQRPVHRRDVFWHQIDAVRWLERLTSDAAPRARRADALWQALQPMLGVEHVSRVLDDWRLPLRLATLLHDIGKPATRTVDADGSTHFFGHSELGAELAEHRLREMRLPSRLVEQVSLLITHHLRPGQVHAPGRPPTDRALHRFHRALGDAATPLCWLFLADSLATAGAPALLPRWSGYAAHVARIVGWQPKRRAAGSHLLDGRAIMAATQLPPGPLVGRIRDQIDEAVAVGEVRTTADARDLAIRLVEQAREAPRE